MRHPFTEAEDGHLRRLVSELGDNDWIAIAGQIEGRTPRQCKERWTHYLSPAIVHDKWSGEEDELLKDLVNQHGKTWKAFESLFPGRIDISIKNRYNVLSRRKAKELKIALKLPLKRKRDPAQQRSEQRWDLAESGSTFDLDAYDDVVDGDWTLGSPFFKTP
jgi:hypothetical protein